MAGPGASRKRARENNDAIRTRGKKARVVHRRQTDYHSSSSEDEEEETPAPAPDVAAPVTEASSDSEDAADPAASGSSDDEEEVAVPEDAEDSEEDDDDDDMPLPDQDSESESDLADEFSDSELDSDAENPAGRTKRTAPNAFALSLQKLLNTAPTAADPMLSRSSTARALARQTLDATLEAKAKRLMKMERSEAFSKGRVTDVLQPEVIGRPDVKLNVQASLEEEKRLRKVGQKGVIRLFNAVRAAQVRAAEAQRDVRKEGMLGISKREAKVQEMTKKGFLDLIASGGGGLKKGPIEEA